MRTVRASVVGISVVLLATSSLYAKKWTTVTGQSFEGDFVRREGTNAVFNANGKEYQYPLTSLSVPDRLFINRTVYEQSRGGSAAPTTPTDSKSTSLPSAKTSELQLAGQPVTPGKQNELDVPITDGVGLKTIKDSYGKPSTKAKMLLVLPSDFDPVGKIYPLLIVSATTDGAGSSIGSAKANYLPDAINSGYVVMAVDGEFGKPGGDSTDFRWALTSSGVGLINKEWPKSKSWPLVPAGVSGGAGYASHQAMMLIQKQAPVIGLLLAVTGWDPTDFPDVVQRTPFSPLHNLPIFVSAGESDMTATKEMTDKLNLDLTRQGFRKVRFEHFAGGHTLDRTHLKTALDWFRQENEKATNGTTRK